MENVTIVKPKEELSKLSDILNKQVANFNVLYVKLHNYHWYVKGPHFFTLHEKFEELYNEVTLQMDEIAERLLTIGGKPVATMKGFLEEASIEEATGSENEEEMVATLKNDMSIIAKELKQGMEEAENQRDEATADMLLGIHTAFEKHIWMLRSFLGN